ncbi:MAG: polysaccharide biosynthesis/export family protein [Candidatus Krumholzibacteriia bacterium]
MLDILFQWMHRLWCRRSRSVRAGLLLCACAALVLDAVDLRAQNGRGGRGTPQPDAQASPAEPGLAEATPKVIAPPPAIEVPAGARHLDMIPPSEFLDFDEPSPESDRLVLGPGDELYVEVPKVEELTGHYNVDPSGDIYMLLLGKITVRGKTIEEFEQELTTLLRSFIGREGRLQVSLAARRVYVMIVGAVRYPGWYMVPATQSAPSLFEVAGGTMPWADRRRSRIVRVAADGARLAIPVVPHLRVRSDDRLVVPDRRDGHAKRMRQVQRLGAGEVLALYMPDGDGSFTEHVVDRNGGVILPGVGFVRVEGLPLGEVEARINAALPPYLREMGGARLALIEKKDFFQLLGHVVNPGWHHVPEYSNVLEAVSLAGGAMDGAVMNEVVIERGAPESRRRISVDLHQYSITGDPRLLTPLHGGDAIFVPIAARFGSIKRSLAAWDPPKEEIVKDLNQQIRVYGEVHRPGLFEAGKNTRLLDVIIGAGGFTPFADLAGVRIIRVANGRRLIQEIDLDEFLKNGGAGHLPSVEAGDPVGVSAHERTAMQKLFGGIKALAGFASDVGSIATLVYLITQL